MHLRSLAMPTPDEQARRAQRRAWLLFCARRTDSRKPKLEDVAVAVGLKAKSASTVSDWEWGISEPKTAQLELLAAYYGIPFRVLSDPPDATTDEERLAGWRAELARAAIGLAHEDLAAEEAGGPVAGVPPAVPRRKRSA